MFFNIGQFLVILYPAVPVAMYLFGLSWTWTYGLCDTEMRLGSSSNIPLQWVRSWVAHTASYVDRPSSAQSVLTSSNHLFFGLPTGLEPWILPNKEMYGSRSAFILQTCPKYDKRRCCTSSTTVLGKPRVILMSSFLHLSLLVTLVFFWGLSFQTPRACFCQIPSMSMFQSYIVVWRERVSDTLLTLFPGWFPLIPRWC